MVEWQANLAIGVLEVDIQHKLLFEKFNDFLEGCERGVDRQGVEQLFWFLQGYAITHFRDEEQLMQRVGFPEYQSHRQRHLEFSADVDRYAERLKKEGPSEELIFDMKSFISNWLVGHISKMDHAIGDFIKAQKR